MIQCLEEKTLYNNKNSYHIKYQIDLYSAFKVGPYYGICPYILNKLDYSYSGIIKFLRLSISDTCIPDPVVQREK